MALRDLLRFIGAYLKLHLKTAMAYRWNFIFQTVFMAINNLAFVLFWIFIFKRVESINGWAQGDVILLFAFGAMSYGILSFFLGNWLYLDEVITKGDLDFYLTLPKPTLLHTLVSRSAFSGFGDILSGIVLFFLIKPPTIENIALFIIFSITSSVIMLNMMILADSLAFWFGRSEGFHSTFFNLILSATSYPSVLYDQAVKFVLFFIVPLFFISNVPVMLLQAFSWKWALGLVAVTFLTSVIALIVFKRGLRRYESGNLFNARL